MGQSEFEISIDKPPYSEVDSVGQSLGRMYRDNPTLAYEIMDSISKIPLDISLREREIAILGLAAHVYRQAKDEVVNQLQSKPSKQESEAA